MMKVDLSKRMHLIKNIYIEMFSISTGGGLARVSEGDAHSQPTAESADCGADRDQVSRTGIL